MVYRKRAGDIEPREARNPDATLTAHSASGRRGKSALRGTDGFHGERYGEDGFDGGDAGPAGTGGSGGRVEVTLSRDGADACLLKGERKRRKKKTYAIDERIDFREAGFIDLDARGGPGGNGGDGGEGGAGGAGRPGDDATRYSSGQDGGHGGDGGRGGNATDGADGGTGGLIRISVDERDMHLLMLMRTDVRGGDGGPAGDNGRGGYGGHGGPGGDSYHWTESESYTDSSGKRKTRTTSHSNPGGSDGPDGRDGWHGDARVSDGNAGGDGRVVFVVGHPSDPKKYPRSYDLRLIGFDHESENKDGIYEPGERVRVHGLRVQNTGGMPTPLHQDVEVHLESGPWLLPEGDPLLVPRGLDGGAAHRFEESRWFTIGDFQPHAPTDPLECIEVIHHRADLPAVHRSFRELEETVPDDVPQFVIGFPVEASDIEGLRALAAGDTARVRFTLSNRSKLALGAATEGKRRVRFRLYAHDSELEDGQCTLVTAAGERVASKDGFYHELDRLGPEETAEFEAILELDPSAPSYRSVTLWLTLELGHLNDVATLRPVQHRAIQIRVADRYQPTDDADLLLVVNHRTTRAALDAWRRLAASLSLTIDTYDVSLERGLLLDREYAGHTLFDRLANKALVILNPIVQTPAGRMSAHVLCSKEQLLEAAANGTSIAFFGMGVSVSRLIAPTRVDEMKSFRDDRTLVRHAATQSLVQNGATIDVFRQSMRPPKKTALVRIARRLSMTLALRHPERRFVVVYDFQRKRTQTGILFHRWRLGSLEVRETLPPTGRILRAKVAEADLHDPAHIIGDDHVLAVLMTMSFADKLERLDELLAQPTTERQLDLIHLVVDAMLVDLATEQRMLLQTRWRSGMDGARMRFALPSLSLLASYVPTASERLDPSSEEAYPLLRLVALLRYWAWAHWRLWEWPVFFLRRAPLAALLVRNLTWQFLHNFVSRNAGAETTQAAMAVASRQLRTQARNIRTAYKNREEHFTINMDAPEGHEAEAERLLRNPLERAGLTSDAEVLDVWPMRVMSRKELDDVTSEDERRDARRSEALARWRDAAADLET